MSKDRKELLFKRKYVKIIRLNSLNTKKDFLDLLKDCLKSDKEEF